MTCRRIHLLLGIQSLAVVLVSFNRLGSWTVGYVAPNQFLRWVDLNNMILALASLLAFSLLREHLTQAPPARAGARHPGLGFGFMVGAYLLAVGYGNHEVTNYLNLRFCSDSGAGATPAQLCDIIAYNDDVFSHLVFFAGFTAINLAIMLTQVAYPNRNDLTVRDNVALTVNALFIGTGIFANLAFEEIGLDLYVVALVAALAVWLLSRMPRQPILRYYTIAYVAGLASTAFAKLT